MTEEELKAAKLMMRSTRAPFTLSHRGIKKTVVGFHDADPYGVAKVPGFAYFSDGTKCPESDLLSTKT